MTLRPSVPVFAKENADVKARQTYSNTFQKKVLLKRMVVVEDMSQKHLEIRKT